MRNLVDPAAVSAPTRSLRVVIGPPQVAREAQLPGQRGAFRADPSEVTAELPRIDPGADPPTTALPRVRERPASRSGSRAGTRTAARPATKTAAPVPEKRGPLQPGTFLLPLRIFLGVAFLLEGLRKLYDPAFLDPDAPGSFAHRIDVLHDGSLFPPVLDLAAQHAISAGLLFAFGQVVVGVGALLGLWTRFMGMLGMLLSLGVLIAVGTTSSPYHAAYVVFLAAWSPLALAGAPMFSVDCWLSLRNWRGPLTIPVRARRRKLGYGSIIAGSGVGLTLLAGALFGHPTAPDTTVTGPGEPETTVTGPPAGAPAQPGPAAVPPPAVPSAVASMPPPATAGKSAAGTPSAAPKTTAAKAPGETPVGKRPPAATGGNNSPAASATQPKPTAEKPPNTRGTIGGTPLGGLLGG